MKPIGTELTNTNYTKPDGWDDSRGTCVTLPVYYDKGLCYSWWKVSWKERLRILLGYPVQLCFVSDTVPPVSLLVGKQ